MTFESENDFFNLADLNEQFDVEFKLAQGRDGQGQLPKSFWETYSAMANTMGGVIVLGVKEENKRPVVVGVSNPDKVIQSLFDQANNPQVVSCNLLTDQSISRQKFGEKTVLFVNIPKGGRKSRPIHLGGNPITGTYRRNNEGDYKCPREVVEQMLGERSSDTQDAVILEGFGLKDIDTETLRIYRQNFSNRQPGHVLNNLDALEFLEQLGGYRRDRQSPRSNDCWATNVW